jgi:D-tyrosyl-tRNA(Tyr) deacylase
MKLLVQRVTQASVQVEKEVVGKIDLGLLVFVGVTHQDTQEQAVWLAHKLVHLRIFEDAQGKLNESLQDKKGAALIISQFTLYADCAEGRRPSFTKAAPPEIAKPLYENFISEVKKSGISVQTGIFGAEMKVSLVNDGPVTLILER